MANFLLVRGTWAGGWCYRDTAAALRKADHQMFTPTQTGGEMFGILEHNRHAHFLYMTAAPAG